MTTRINAAIAAGSLALGILVGSAGAIVVRDAATAEIDLHMRDMSALSGSMASMAGMMSMMSTGDMAGMMSMMGSSPQMGPDSSVAPGEHQSHHEAPSPEATR